MMVAMTDSAPLEIRRNEPMLRHTSWRVGGSADMFIRPTEVSVLGEFLSELPHDTPVLFVGFGSNLLVRDGGFRGVVVSMSRLERQISHMADGRVVSGAGASCARLARECAAWQLGPATFFAGIPGTVGGALAMNAGAFGGETWDSVVSVRTIDRGGEIRVRQRSHYEVGYRHVSGPSNEWFISAEFQFQTDQEADRSSIRSLLAVRSAKQPLGQASCGSVFRNPLNDHAGRLIESAGLKGYRVGGACVSNKHANFIVNDGDATAADIENLIDHIREQVQARSGVELQTEVRIVGESIKDEN